MSAAHVDAEKRKAEEQSCNPDRDRIRCLLIPRCEQEIAQLVNTGAFAK